MVWKELLTNLVDRGLTAEGGLLVVIDGSKALRKAVKDIFGGRVLVQRCLVHKKRNILEHLPEKKQAEVARKFDAAWREKDYHTTRGK